MINFLTFSQEWKYCTSKKYVDKNFKTGVRRLLASIFCHDIVTRVTPSIIAPFFPPRRRDRISRNRYLRKLRTGRRWFNRAARSRRVRLACETEALNDSGHLSYERSRPPPFTISSIQHRYCPPDRSSYRIGISRPLLPHLAPRANPSFRPFFFVSCSLLLPIVKLSGQASNQFNFYKNLLQNEIMKIEISWKAMEIFIGNII